MEHGKKLMHDTMIYSIAQFGSRILLFLMLPFYTHYFSPAEFGTWDLALTTIAFMTPLLSMEMISAVYRWLLDAQTFNDQQRVIATGTWIIGRNMILFNSVAVLILLFIPIPYGWLALLVINTDLISSYIQQITRGLMRNTLFASLGIIHALIFVSSLLILIFLFHFRIEAFFYATACANIVVAIIAAVRLKLHTYSPLGNRSRGLMKPMYTYALPIIPGALSWWVITLADRYFISIYLGVEANGIYAVAAKIPAILMLLNNVFALAWKDSAIRTFHQAEKNTYYSTVFATFFKTLCTAVIFILLTSKLLITWFIDQAYIDAWKYGNILIIGALFHACALFWAAGFHGAKQTNAIFTSAVLGAILSIAGNIALIPVFGLYAVAITSTASFLIVWIVRIRQARATFHIRISRKDVLFYTMCGLAAFIIPHVSTTSGIIMTTLGAGLFFLWYWRTTIWNICTYVKRSIARSY